MSCLLTGMKVAMKSITLMTLDVIHWEYKSDLPASASVAGHLAGTWQKQQQQQQPWASVVIGDSKPYTMTKICPANLAPILGSVLGMLAACVPNMVELTLYGPCLDAALSAFGSSCPKLASLNVQIPHVPTQALQGIDHLLPHLTAISVFTLDMTSGTAASSYMDSFFVSIQNCKRLTSCCINLDLDHHPLYCINWSLLPLSLETLHCECELQQHASLGPLIHRVSKLTLQHVPNHHLLDFLAACPRLTHFGVAASFRSRFIISCDPEEHPAELKARIQAMTFSLKYAPLQFCGTTAQLQDTLGWLPRFPKVRNVTIAVIGDMQGRFLGRIGHVFPDLVSLKLRGRQMAASLQSRVMDSKLFMPLADCCFVNSLTISDRFTLTTKGLILLCSRMPRLSSLKIEMSKGVDPTSVSAAVKGWGRRIHTESFERSMRWRGTFLHNCVRSQMIDLLVWIAHQLHAIDDLRWLQELHTYFITWQS